MELNIKKRLENIQKKKTDEPVKRSLSQDIMPQLEYLISEDLIKLGLAHEIYEQYKYEIKKQDVTSDTIRDFILKIEEFNPCVMCEFSDIFVEENKLIEGKKDLIVLCGSRSGRSMKPPVQFCTYYSREKLNT